MNKLLPCPFCGSKAVSKKQAPSLPELPNGWWMVECTRDTPYYHKRGTGCPVGPMASGDSLAEVTTKWNTRSGTP